MNKTDFCQSLPFPKKVKWYDLTGVVQIDRERVAEISLVTRHTHQHYEGFEVKIIGKKTGAISKKTFWFNDYMARTEDVAKHPNASFQQGFGVIAYTGWDWYILRPSEKAQNQYVKAIIDWIDEYR